MLGVVASTEQGGAYEANDAFLDLIGHNRDDLAAGRISYQSITAPEWAADDRRALEQLRAAGELPTWAAADAKMAEIVASVHPRSALATPLLAGQRTLGGLIEDRHRDITEGLSLLAETLRSSALSSAEHMCASVAASLLGTGRRADDVCLLAAHLTG